MIYFLLPNTHQNVFKYLKLLHSDKEPKEAISHSLSHYLTDIKNRLTSREKDWDTYKRYTNTYEYIHTVIPSKKKAISKYKPLSRSYFKMIEMIHDFNLFQSRGQTYNRYFTAKQVQNNTEPITTFHLAEGPGGFIEATLNYRNNPEDIYYGMTIQDDKNDGSIPSWRKSETFLLSHPNIIIENGEENNGDLLSIANFNYCYHKYGSSMDLITADGGFDFSIEFNKQEINMSRLLFAQICYALVMQKRGGNFVLKIFDVFHQHTLDLLYLLSSLYQHVYISKPQTSRMGNSEKYVICKGFLCDNVEYIFTYVYNVFKSVLELDDQMYIHRFLDISISNLYKNKIEEYNSIFGQQQIENIHYTISLFDKNSKIDKLNQLSRNNIIKCINWCIKYNVPYNSIINNNIFLNTYSSAEDLYVEENKLVAIPKIDAPVHRL
jgi:23S rRNA U2552 (ribose-2'-O)-methylase RlmE/FtsJ